MTAPAEDEIDDAAVISRSWHEPEAFAELYDRHAAAIHRYVTRRLGDEVADDVVAECFLAAFGRRERYDLSRADARPWLDARVAAASVQRKLAAVLAALPARDREVLLLIAWAELSYAEVAQALAIPVGTVRSRLNRARRKTREALGGQDPTRQREELYT